ncbi:MAG: 5'-deoxynucleotidase [Pygmaiobacter sp.]
MKLFAFPALLARQKYIARWGLMRSSRTETLSEHTAETAQLAFLLASLAKGRYGEAVKPERVAAAALYHDAGEILTGDLPTPIKYKNDTLKNAYKELEKQADQSLLCLLPPEVLDELAPALTGSALTAREAAILKAADKLSALIKCVEEQQSGNLEFESARAAQLAALQLLGLPEVEFFLETMLPCYYKTLDELTRGAF